MTGWKQLPTTLAILRTNIARESSKAYRKLMAPAGMRELAPKYPQDFSEFTRGLWDQVSPYTMTTQERVVNLEYAVRYIVAAAVAGDIVETGVGAGGSMMAAALTLQSLGVTDRRMWLYDTFSGMPEPADADFSVLGKPAKRKYKRKDQRRALHLAQLSARGRPSVTSRGPGIRRHSCASSKAWFRTPCRLTTANRLHCCAWTPISTNRHARSSSTFIPSLRSGACLVVDDYYRWLGQRKAVDEYLRAAQQPVFLMRIDDHAAMGIKPTRA